MGRMGQTGAASWLQTFNSLYANGEQGIAKLDFSDFTGMYQDRARTVPYTAVEQPLGSFTGLNGVIATAPADVNRGVVSARYNLLTKTEQFDAAAWITPPTGTVKSNNAGTDPLGGGTAGKVECTEDGVAIYIANNVATGLITGATYRATVHVRNGGGIPSITFYNGQYGAYKSATINLITGAVTGSNYTTPPVVSVSGDGWVSISVDIVAPGTFGNYCYIQSSSNAAVGNHFFIWHPCLTLTTDSHLPYQRVNTPTDYDTAGFPHYLKFNGTNTTYVTPSIDFTGTDKMTVWAGVTPGSVAASAMLLELSDISNANDGAFKLLVPETYGDPNVSSSSRGTSANASNQGVFSTTISTASPLVISTAHDISGDRTTISVNGVAYSPAIGDKGAGDFGNYPLYIGSRAGTSLYFNGRLYSPIVRGAATPLPQIEAVETLIRQKMRLP